jgi:hypothetical protein
VQDATTDTMTANEYFDDECILDTSSSVGAFIQQHFKDNIPDFVRHVKTELIDIPSQRVPRAERRVDESYGIGKAVFLSLPPGYRLILVSATTERAGIGLRAEPHFLYAALEGVAETMNERRSILSPCRCLGPAMVACQCILPSCSTFSQCALSFSRILVGI